jgi:hypothetical protein
MGDLSMAEAVATLEQQVRELERDKTEQWKKIDEIRDRLPNWAVMTMSVGGFVIGFLVNWLMSCLK